MKQFYLLLRIWFILVTTDLIEFISCLIFFQCAKLLLAACPVTIFPEVYRGQYRHYHRYSEESIALREGARLQPLVATARLVRAVASSLTRLLILFQRLANSMSFTFSALVHRGVMADRGRQRPYCGCSAHGARFIMFSYFYSKSNYL